MLSERLGLKKLGQNTTLSLYLVVFGENSQISQKKKNFSVLTVNAKSTSF